MAKFSILINAASADLCESVRAMLADQPDLDVRAQVSEKPGLDPLAGPQAHPDLLIAVLGSQWDEGLKALAKLPAASRPPTIAVGASEDPQAIRRAMQAGMRDYLSWPLNQNDLLLAVRRIGLDREVPAAPAVTRAPLIAVINVKGGSGASFIAANLAHIVAVQRKIEVGLLDLDLQFGALPLAFDLEPRSTLLEALAAAAQLDATALRAYAARHASGVSVLSAMAEQMPLPWELSPDSLNRVIKVMRETFPLVVADLPRQIDPLTTAVLGQADHVIMVMQQSLAHARDAKRMQRVMVSTLGIPRDRLLLVINRNSEKQSVRSRDVQEAVDPPSMMALPNDYITVSEALNIGAPVYEYDREAPITRALIDLAARILPGGAESATLPKRGFRQAVVQALRSA